MRSDVSVRFIGGIRGFSVSHPCTHLAHPPPHVLQTYSMYLW